MSSSKADNFGAGLEWGPISDGRADTIPIPIPILPIVVNRSIMGGIGFRVLFFTGVLAPVLHLVVTYFNTRE